VPGTPSLSAGQLFGYQPLDRFGIGADPIGDEEIVNYDLPMPAVYGGQEYRRIGVTSNGYLVVGGGDEEDVVCCELNRMPDPARPNNVLAPFWTDLNPAAAGALRIGTLTDGADTWLVVDWEGVREFRQPRLASFQIWIGVNGDANPGTDVSYAFGTIQGNGDGGFLTVGAENNSGSKGQVTYFNGTGTLPANGTQLVVGSVPGAIGSHTISFDAKGLSAGPWTNCAEMTSPAFDGTSVRCTSGTVTP
jgi:hypothetical protein